VLAIIPEITTFREWQATDAKLTAEMELVTSQEMISDIGHPDQARNYVLIAQLRGQRNKHRRKKRLLALSAEADCAALRTEYDALVQEVTQRCEELLATDSASLLMRVGCLLEELRQSYPHA
jgi:hypothetical protein